MVHENVERIRKAKGVTKTHLAKKLNMSLQGYRHITSGKVRLDVERLKIIAEELGVNPVVFFDNELTESVVNRARTNDGDPSLLWWSGLSGRETKSGK